MGIGTGIFLFVVGAILAFALNVEVSWIDLDLVGYLLMGAGVVVAIISGILLVAQAPQRDNRAFGHPPRRRREGDRAAHLVDRRRGALMRLARR